VEFSVEQSADIKGASRNQKPASGAADCLPLLARKHNRPVPNPRALAG